jgi:hypothetical protein
MSARKPEQSSPYCAFKNDRDRLWALVSRDLRLIIIAVLVAMATPSTPTYLSSMWTTVLSLTRAPRFPIVVRLEQFRGGLCHPRALSGIDGSAALARDESCLGVSTRLQSNDR